jgi:hypothetical protein
MSDVNKFPEVSVSELISDMKHLIGKYGTVTRDLYRSKGTYSERTWENHFATFKDFVKAASVQPKETSEESYTYTDKTADIFLPKTNIHTLEELIEHCNIDLSIWNVEKFVVNKWEMGYTIGSGDETKAESIPLFQVKASLSKKQYLVDARQEIEDLKRAAKETAHLPPIIIKSGVSEGNCLEVLIPDLHAGKFAWHKETGHKDYDTPTAIATYEAALQTILERAKGYTFDEIVLGVGNDLLNSDDYNSQTTKGTLVNSDTRYPKTYKAVREMLCRAIEKLRHYCKKVVVKVIPGNHDTVTTFTLGDSLECYFHNYDDVVIDNAPSPHKFYRWGSVFIGFTHGDKGKKSDYGLWMATEHPKDFGETKFREIHIGHTHGLKVDEKFGVRVRTFASLSPADAWHASNMFVGNLQQAEAIVWNKEYGRIAEFIYTQMD